MELDKLIKVDKLGSHVIKVNNKIYKFTPSDNLCRGCYFITDYAPVSCDIISWIGILKDEDIKYTKLCLPVKLGVRIDDEMRMSLFLSCYRRRFIR